MANDWFRFKQFMVKQDKTAMKVGTDGVLLGSWAGVENPARILDIGTGTGLIALMMAQRYPSATVDAVEIDKDAAGQAAENFRHSAWDDRLSIHHQSLREFAVDRKRDYDLIVSNPPYFSRSMKAPGKGRTLARHDDLLSKEELLQDVVRLLKPEGVFAVILPFGSSAEFISIATGLLLFPQKGLKVRPVPGRPFARILISFSFTAGEFHEDEIIIESGGRHVYSEEYIRLTKDFYLAF